MSTCSNIIVEDQYHRIQISSHSDGCPESVLPDIQKALPYAWKLPRFEADEFAAAIVAAWKQDLKAMKEKYGFKGTAGGGIYIDGTPKGFEMIHGDTEWVYVIAQTENGPVVRVYDWHPYWLDRRDPAKVLPVPLREIPLLETGDIAWLEELNVEDED